jgi:apocytochrome f
MSLKKFFLFTLRCCSWFCVFADDKVKAYPIFAQQNYKNPREANGRIVCANCHLAQKPVELEVPQAILPDIVFEAIVRIPYDQKVKQVLGNGKSGDLNVGAVLIFPDGFRLAPPERVSNELKDRVGQLSFQPYTAEQKKHSGCWTCSGQKVSRTHLSYFGSKSRNREKC